MRIAGVPFHSDEPGRVIRRLLELGREDLARPVYGDSAVTAAITETLADDRLDFGLVCEHANGYEPPATHRRRGAHPTSYGCRRPATLTPSATRR